MALKWDIKYLWEFMKIKFIFFIKIMSKINYITIIFKIDNLTFYTTKDTPLFKYIIKFYD